MTSPSYVSPAGTSRLPSPRRRYVYGIICTDDQVLFEVDGIEAPYEVYAVGIEGLAVVTSPVEREGFVGLERGEAVRYLGAHQRVLETVQQDFAVLPVKFGTILADEEQLLTLLRRGSKMLKATLEAYAGKEQYEVVVLWDVAQVFQIIAADEQVVALKSQIAALPPEESVHGKVLLGRLVHSALQARRAAIAAAVIGALSDLAEDSLENPVMDDSMVCNTALLIPQTRVHELDERLSALDERFGGRLQIRCVGPLPPYSFTTLEVQQAQPEAVAAAREGLCLPEATRFTAIKAAYRRLAAQTHPDRNPGADAAAAMEALTAAYKLLVAIALAQAPADNLDDWPCRFDRDGLGDTLMLTLRRQEVAPGRDEG